MGELSAIPPKRTQGSVEIVGWEFNYTDQLDTGESVQSATATLVELPSETPYNAGFQGAPQVTGAGTVLQVIQALIPRKRYRLVVAAAIGADKILAQSIELECPF